MANQISAINVGGTNYPLSVSWGSITGTLSWQTDLQSALNTKVDGFTLSLPVMSSGNPRPVKFCTINYSTCDSENGVLIKLSIRSGHGNGSSYNFLEDAILSVNLNGNVSVDTIKSYGAATTYDSANRQFGDIFWVVDSTNKIVDFYLLSGQYSYVFMTPWMRLNQSTKGTVTQYTSANLYSSGTMVWANKSGFTNMGVSGTTLVLNSTVK